MKKHHHKALTQTYTVSYWLANRASLDAGPAFNIGDTAANIGAALNQLNGDSHIAQIIISDNTAITLSVVQLTTDATALSKLTNGNGSTAALTVSDTAAHISASFATIATEGLVTKIIVTDSGSNTVTLTGSQVANYLTAIGELYNSDGSTHAGVHAKDTAANLAVYLNGIESAGSAVTQVIVSNSTAMTLTAAEVSNDAGTLAKVVYNNGGTVAFKVNDTGASITTYLDALQAQTKITTITDSDNSAITLSVATTVSDAGALGKIVNQNGSPYTLTVADTAANVAGNVAALNANTHITSIAITDTAADVQTYLDTLAGITNTMTIALSDGGTPTIAITLSQFTGDASVLGDISSAYHLTVSAVSVSAIATVLANPHVTSVAVSDSAANVQGAIDTLESDVSKISTITLTDGSTPTLTIAQTQYLNDGSALAKIGGSWNLDVTGVDVTHAASIAGGTHVTAVFVSDIGTNFGPWLTTLLGVEEASKLGGITVSDGGTIGTTEATYTECAAVFADITGSYSVALTAVLAADAASLVGNDSHITSLSISDSAANVQSALNSLESVHSKVTTIALSDGTTPTLTITDTQFHNDASVLSDISSSYNLAVTGVTVSDATTVAANSHVTSISISDSASNVQGGLDTLEVVHSKIATIALTDGGTPTLSISETQYNSDSAVLNDISNAFNLTLTGVLAADASGLAGATVGNGTVTNLYVSDTAAHIATSLGALNAVGDVQQIVISNGNSIQISIASLEANGTALGELYASNGSTPATVTIYDTASDITAALSTLNGDNQVTKIVVSDDGLTAVTINQLTLYSHALNELYESDGTTPAQLTVTDTAGNISGAFDTLNGASRVSQIIVSDSGSGGVVTITAAQAGSDGTALGELYLANGTTHATVMVSDTATHISGAFDGLNGNSHVAAIVVSDSGSHEVTLSVASALADTTAESELYQSDGSTPANVAVADSAAHVANNASSLNGNAHVDHVYVTDNGGNVGSHFDNLNGVDNLSISLTGGTLAITESQLANDTTAFGAITTAGFTVAITHVLAADAPDIQSEVTSGNSNAVLTSISVSDSAANISTALDALDGNSYVNQIIVTDSGAGHEVQVSVAQLSSDSSALADLLNADGVTPANIVVSDTASDISSDLAGLNSDTQVNKIVVSDDGLTAVTIAQITSYSHALNELYQSDGVTPAQLTVTDTAANISAAFDTLNGASRVATIAISDSGTGGVVTIGAHSAAVDTAALSELYQADGSTPAQVIVADSASNVSSYLDGVNTNFGYISKIEVTDGDSANVTVSVGQLTSDATALANMYENTSNTLQTLTVSDSAANISADIDNLNGSQITKIVVSDSGSNEVTTDYAQITSDATALGELRNADGSTLANIAVTSDTGSILEQFSTFNSDSQVNKIILTNDVSGSNEVIVSAAQVSADAAALAKLYDSNGTTHASIIVSDSAANIASAFGTLNGDSQINKVIVSDGPGNEVTLSVAAALADTTAEGLLYQSNGTTPAHVAVSDTAANVVAHTASLNGNTHIDHVNVTDSATNVGNDASLLAGVNNLSITVTGSGTQFMNIYAGYGYTGDAYVIDAITNPSNVNITVYGTAAANAAEFAALDNVSYVSVIDSAANISQYFDALNSNSKLDAIDINGGYVTLSVNSYLNDSHAEEVAYNNDSSAVRYIVSDTAANVVAAASSLNAAGNLLEVQVADSTANVASHLDALNGVDNLSISFTGNGTQTLTIGYGHLGDTAALDAITNTFDLAITGATAAGAAGIASQVSALSSSVTLTSVSVTDTASHIASSFGALNGVAHLTQIIVSDSNSHEVTLTAASAVTNTTAEGLLLQSDGSTPANIAVADNAANVAGDASQIDASAHIDHVYVADTAANVAASLDALETVKDLSIAISGTLSITEYQLNHDAGALGSITGSFDVAVTDVLAADVGNIAAEVGDANANATLTSISVTDTAANVSSNFDALDGTSTVGYIEISDSGTGGVVTINVAQSYDSHALGDLHNSDGSQARVTVADTGLNISNAFDDLAHNNSVNLIVDTNDATLTVSAYVAQDSGEALGEFVRSDGTTHAVIDVVDSAANISSYFDDLQDVSGSLGKIIVSDSNTNEVTIAIAQLSDSDALGELYNSDGTTPAHVAIEDSAANIQASLDTLNSVSQVDHIIIQDNGALSLAAESAVNDATAISELENADHSAVILTVSDSAANVAAYLDQLNPESNISSIVISDSQPLTLTGEQMEDTSALGKLSNADTSAVGIIVLDTAAGISSHLAAIAANNDVLTITDSDDAALTVSVADLGTYAVILSEITNSDGTTPATIDVLDTAANIQDHLADLNNNPTPQEIVISDDAALVLSIAQYAGAPNVFDRLHNENGSPYTLNISDNGANISSALDSLGGDSHIATITDTNDAAVTLTVDQITTDASALAKLVNGDNTTYTLSVNDVAADIGGAALDALNGNSHVVEIVVTDSAINEITVSVAQFTSDAHAISELFDADGTTPASVVVSDTAGNIGTALDALNANSRVGKIVVSDSGSNEVHVSVAQLTSDAHALGEMYESDGSTAAHVAVSDTASNIQGALGSLNGNGQVDRIIVSDSANNEVQVSVSGLSSYSAALGELVNADGSTPAKVTVVDTASAIQGGLSGLQSDTQVNKIDVSNTPTEVTVNVAGLSTYAAVLGELYNADGSAHASVTVSDTAATVQGDLSGLQSDTQVNKIEVSDTPNEVTVNVAGLTTYAAVLGELYNANGSAHAHVTVSDTASAIQGDLGGLSADSQVNKIEVSNTPTEVTVSVAGLTSYATALGELYNADGSAQANVTVSDSAANIGGSSLDSLQSDTQVNKIVVSDSGSHEVVVSVGQLTGDSSALAELYDANGSTHANVVVSDSSYNISLSFDSINGNSQVNKIIAADDSGPNGFGPEVTVTAAGLTSDAHALSELYQSDGQTLADIYVNDTAANISAAFDALNNDSRVNGIVINDGGTVTLTALQAYNDATVLGELYTGNLGTAATVEVLDTASNIQDQLDNLNGNSHVGSIVVSDTPDFQLSAVQVATDTTALGLISGDNSGVTIEVGDTAANITTYLNALEANDDITSITISDNGHITVSTDQLLSTDNTAISLLQNADQADYPNVLLTVEDSAANIGAHLTDLEAYTSGSPQVTSVVISDNQAVSVAISDLSLDATIIGDLSNANETPYTLNITGNASQISSALGTIETYVQGGHVATITITDSNPVGVSVAEITSDAGALALLSNAVGGGYSLAVSDMAANIAGDLGALNSNGHVVSITLTDGGTPTLTITEGQLAADTTALGEITNASFNVAVTNVLAADAANIAGEITAANAHASLTSISVTDTAANIAAVFDTLGGVSDLSKIIVSNSLSAQVTLSVASALADTVAEGLLYRSNGTTSAHVAVSDTAANVGNNASSIDGNAHIDHVYVSDSAANIGANFANLNGVNHLAVTINDSGTLTITEGQLGADTTALGDIVNASFNVAVTNVLAADAGNIAGEVTSANLHASLTSISVTDTAAHIAAVFNTIGGVANLTNIIVSDSGSAEVTLSVSSALSDPVAEGLLLQSDGTTPAHVAVSDTAAAISGNLDDLAGNSHVNAIHINDNNAVSVAESSFVGGLAALGEITNDAFTIDVTGVTVAQLSTVTNDFTGLGNSADATLSIAVRDSGADISAGLDALNANTHVTSIVISDNAALALAAHSAVLDSTALNLLSNQNGQPVSLTVLDTATNITTYLDQLNGISTISAITISDNNPLTLSAVSVAGDALAIAKLGNANGQPIAINVVDTAAHISTYLDALEANNYIDSITVSDNLSVVVSTAQLTSDSDALAALVNGNGSNATVTVLDTAAAISADLGSLNTDSQVTSIVISNNAQLALNVSQVVNDSHALGELSNANHTNVTEKVSDSANNIQTYLDNLQADAQITSIVVSNNVALTLTAAEVAHDGTALSEVSNKNGGTVSFNVSDTGANVSTYLDALAGNSKIATIKISDNGSVTLSVAQLTSDAVALGKLVNQNGNPYTLTVNDTAAHLSGAEFDALNGNTHVTSIVVSDNAAITLTVSEFTNDTRALGELSNANNQAYSITISDTANNIASDLSVLNGSTHVHKIIVTDSGSGGTITLTAAQALSDATALGEMYQANGTTPFLTNISDSSADVTTYLDALQGIVGDLGSITVSDYSQIGVSVAQVIADANVLGKLHYLNGQSSNLHLSDTAADISANIATLGANGHVQSTTVTDSGVVTSTFALYSQYNSLFYNIQGTHYLDITNVTGRSYSSFTETINGSHQILLQDFYDANGNILSQLAYVYHQDGTETITGSYIQGQAYTSYVQNLDTQGRTTSETYYLANGNVYDTTSFVYNQDGTVSESITGLQGLTLETILYDVHGAKENQFNFNANNTETVYFYENGQTFTDTGVRTTVNLQNSTTGHTFNFNGAFGTVAINGYVPGSETMNFDHNDFANIAAVEAHTQAYGTNGTQIVLDGNDVIILQGVTVAQFEAHTGDWHFI